MAQSPISSPQAVSLAPDGTVEWAKNADSLDYSIWSVTKTFTAYYGLQADSSQITDIDATRTYFGGGTIDRLSQGDVASVRDLYYATMLQSNNGAADNIGYAIIADPSPHASHLGAIVEAMETWYAAEFGWTGFHFSSLSGLGGSTQNRASARMVAELLRAVRTNQPALHDIMRTVPDHTFDVGGPSPRSITVTHTLAGDAATIPQWDGAKSGSTTGTGATYAAGVLWVDGDGGTHTLAVIGASSASARSADIASIIGDVVGETTPPPDPSGLFRADGTTVALARTDGTPVVLT